MALILLISHLLILVISENVYASDIQNANTNHENVKFNAYFENKEYQVEAQQNSNELKMYFFERLLKNIPEIRNKSAKREFYSGKNSFVVITDLFCLPIFNFYLLMCDGGTNEAIFYKIYWAQCIYF